MKIINQIYTIKHIQFQFFLEHNNLTFTRTFWCILYYKGRAKATIEIYFCASKCVMHAPVILLKKPRAVSVFADPLLSPYRHLQFFFQRSPCKGTPRLDPAARRLPFNEIEQCHAGEERGGRRTRRQTLTPTRSTATQSSVIARAAERQTASRIPALLSSLGTS
jgi:hypothetical protein